MKFMNSESIAFLIEVRLVLGRVLTVRENEGAFWILKMFSISNYMDVYTRLINSVCYIYGELFPMYFAS